MKPCDLLLNCNFLHKFSEDTYPHEGHDDYHGPVGGRLRSSEIPSANLSISEKLMNGSRGVDQFYSD